MSDECFLISSRFRGISDFSSKKLGVAFEFEGKLCIFAKEKHYNNL